MKDATNLHLKVQNLCDCFAATDPLKEMSEIQIAPGKDIDEAALKWIALAVLHGINTNAKEIALAKTKGGVKVTAEYRKAELPAPGGDVGDKIIEAMKQITHIESNKGEATLAFGIRNNSMDLKIKTKQEGGDEKITIKFP